MNKVEEYRTMTVQDAVYIVLHCCAGMQEDLAKAWAKAVDEAMTRACGLTDALIQRTIFDYYLLERYSEAALEKELKQFNHNLKQLGEPPCMRKSRVADKSFCDLLKSANEAGCAHLPELEKEGFTCELTWRNALYEVLTAGESTMTELPAQAINPPAFDILPCALWLAVWMRKYAHGLAAPSRAALDPIALRLASLYRLGYANGVQLLKLRFAVQRRFEAME